MGAGPLTGSLERPSQGALENRKAREKRSSNDRDAVSAARKALVGVHRAEMQVMVARHAAERRHILATARGEAAAEQSAIMRAIAAKYSDRLARVFDSGDARSAWAARDRLKLEEAIETAQMSLASAQTSAHGRRAALAGLRITQRAERQGLSVRQRRQRAMLGVILSARRRGRPVPQSTSIVGPRRTGRVYRVRQRKPQQ